MKIHTFKLPTKFKSIKRENRLVFLKANLKLDDNNVYREELINKRKGFNYNKEYLFPLKGIQCYICDKTAELRHHVVPLVKGGRNKISNIVPLCHKCHCSVHPHMQKGAKIIKFKLISKPIINPVLCAPKQKIVVIPPKLQ